MSWRNHSKQEEVFRQVKDRAMVVRPCSLVDNHATGKVQVFGDLVKSPNIHTDRADIAKLLTAEICESPRFTGRTINVTTKK